MYQTRGRPRLAYSKTKKFPLLVGPGGNFQASASNYSQDFTNGFPENLVDTESDEHGRPLLAISFQTLRLVCAFRRGELCRDATDLRKIHRCELVSCRLVSRFQSRYALHSEDNIPRVKRFAIECSLV